jgi:hypothetical protein
MSENKPTFQGYHQWYAAKYAKSDEKFAKCLKYVTSALKQMKNASAFCTDYNLNVKNIMLDLEDPDYYKKCAPLIDIDEDLLLSHYGVYKGYQKVKDISNQAIVPTWKGLVKKDVECVITETKPVFLVGENHAEVKPKQMEKDIGSYFDTKGAKYRLQNERKVILISDLAHLPYIEVKKRVPKNISVDNKVSAEVVVNYVENIKTEAVKEDTVNAIKDSLRKKSTDIPIMTELNGKREAVPVSMPNILKNFMNPTHLVNSQDIAEAISEREGVPPGDKSSATLAKEFLDTIGAEEKPKKMLFNQAWLDNISIDKLIGYCPVFTGMKKCSWILYAMAKEEYPPVVSKDQFKLVLVMVQKIAKLFALWLRGGMKASSFEKYIEQALKIKKTTIFGATIMTNVGVWLEPVTIKKFRQMSVLGTKEEVVDMFGTEGDFDAKLMDEFYEGPTFEEELPRIIDRDKGELNESPKPQRGGNVEGIKEANSKHERKKKSKKGKDDYKISFSKDSSSHDSSDSKKKKSKKAKTKKKKKAEGKDDDSSKETVAGGLFDSESSSSE